MRKLTTIFAALLISAAATFAQAPQGFSYQAVVRDAQNAIVANQTVDVTLTILQGADAESATPVFSEQHAAKTNANGLFTLTVGSVDAAGFAAINWAGGNLFLKTESRYGTSVTQMLSVPFALYAQKAGDIDVQKLTKVLNSSDVQEIIDYVSATEVSSKLKKYAKTEDVEADYAKKTDIPAAPDLSNYALKSDIPTIPAVPTKVSDLENDANYLTEHQSLADYAKKTDIPVAPDLSGYALKSDIPTIPTVPTKVSAFENDANYLTKHQSLADYAKKSDIPVVPTKTSDLQNDSGFLTTHQDLSAYALKTDIPTEANLEDYAKTSDIEANYAKKTDIPAAPDLSGYALKSEISSVPVSAFENDANYLTSHQDLSGYYSKSEVDNLCADMAGKISKLNSQLNHGAINAPFSVSAESIVYFSQGNLQYQASTGTWRFAENQYDMIGSDNNNISSSYTGWIDIFGWGTSGWDGGTATAYQPYSTSTNENDYGPTGTVDLTGDNAQYDWGVHNAISNSGNATGLWRTLTNVEWTYLLNTRTTTSGQRYAKAQVHGVNGLILLPDNWDAATYTFNKTNTSGAAFETVPDENWSAIEAAGAVFLPAAGGRNGSSSYNLGTQGNYWSGSASSATSAYDLLFESGFVNTNHGGSLRYGRSVRLVATGSYASLTGTPTKVSEFENDANYLTSHQDISGKANKSEMTVTPGTGANSDKTTIQLKTGTTATVLTTHQSLAAYARTADLAPVATTGSYASLTGTPTKVSDFENDANYLTSHQDISGKANKSEMTVTPGTGTNADKTTIKLKTGTTATVLTKHQDLSGYYSKAEVEALLTALKAEIPNMVALANCEAVDLGLTSGNLWATCNLGASSPEEYGDYYAWGETTTKAIYSWSSYRYCISSGLTLTKYCYDAEYGNNGFTDALTTLEPADDAATAKKGTYCATPTITEWTELYDECYWKWTTNYNGSGKSGYIVYKSADKTKDKQRTKGSSHNYSIATDTHIFLPAAGYIGDSNQQQLEGYLGNYWSASLDEEGPCFAVYIAMEKDYVKSYFNSRYIGYPVRPIRRR